MRENIQRPTSNIQHPMHSRWVRLAVGRWILSVGCFLFSAVMPRRSHMRLLLLLLMSALTLSVYGGGVRVRDLVMVSGARDNQLIGYGLVAGLAGDGDKDPTYTKQTVAN